MKNTNYTLICTFFALLMTGGLLAQNEYTQDIAIPLSNPGEKGKLQASLHNGSLTVEGYNGNEVMITVITREKEDNSSKQKSIPGLKRIPNAAMSFEITEDNNKVRVNGGHKGRVDFVVKVPKNFHLSLSTHHNGQIKVSGVTGEIEVDAHHGGIELNQVAGSVIADTHHGAIKVTLNAITSNKPMAFSTYHGNVEVTLPSSVNASTKIKTAKGDVFTDFDLNMRVQKPETSTDNRGRTKVKMGGWLYGDLGKGGPEFMFNTYHGDIIIKKG